MDGTMGEIRAFAGNFSPRGWAICDGSTIAISQNTALFSILGTIYGGDGISNFKLPDLRGRVPVGVGQAPGLSNWVLGEVGGVEATSNVPAHTHAISNTSEAFAIQACLNDDGSLSTPEGNAFAKITNGYVAIGDADSQMAPIKVDMSGVQIQSTGNMVDVIQPSLGLNWIICTEGTYPSRN